MTTTMQAFALPPRLTTRYSAETWAARMKDLRMKDLTWESDQKKRPSRVPAKAVCWTSMAIEDAGQHAAYLYVIPSKKGGYLLRSKYRHDPRGFPVKVCYPFDNVPEYVPLPEQRAKSVGAAKTLAQTVLDELLAVRRERRRTAPVLKEKPRKRTREEILAAETPPPLTFRERYVRDGAGLWDLLGIDPDTIPTTDAEFETWFNRRACGGSAKLTTEVKTHDGKTVVVAKGKDKFGMRLGTRAARINAVLAEEPLSAKKIKKLSGESSVSGHLAKLVKLKVLATKVGKKTGATLYYLVGNNSSTPADKTKKKK